MGTEKTKFIWKRFKNKSVNTNPIFEERGRAKPRRLEGNLQQACVHWTHLAFPLHAKHLFSIPNGGKRNPYEAEKLRLEGVKAGVSDLFFAYPSGIYHGLFLEAKFGNNDLTDQQEAFFDLMRNVGYRCEVFRSIEEYSKIFLEYLDENKQYCGNILSALPPPIKKHILIKKMGDDL